MNEETIFATARRWSEGPERRAYLDQVCAGDQQLRQQVERLLAADALSSSVLDRGPGNGSVATQATITAPEEKVSPSLLFASFLTPCTKAGCLGRLGQYEVLELLGQGGMGTVFRAFDPKLNRIVAIKALLPEFAANAMARKRFLREAQAAAAISHDHVVTIHAVEDEAQVPYLVMECVIGQSLQQKLDRSGAMQVTEILRMGMQIAMGLAAAHGQGLVHRDIKPANILLENGVERVKLTDFGLARAVDDVGITQSGVITGTPQYMSPEQAMGDAVDHRSDLFSLGSVLYAMCTGRPAFRAETTLAVMRRVCDGVARPIREVNPEIPDFLIAVIDRLLMKSPEDRYQTAAEVATLLQEHLAQLQQAVLSVERRRKTPDESELRSNNQDASTRRSEMIWSIVGLASLVTLLIALSRAPWQQTGTAQPMPQAIASGQIPLNQRSSQRSTPETVGALKESTISDDLPANPPPSENGLKDSPQPPPLAVAPFDRDQAQYFQAEWARFLNVPVEYRNASSMKFRLIPPGEFQMGSTVQEANELEKDLEQAGVGAFEKFVAASSVPQHSVRLTQPFYMGQYEVTVEQFQQFVDATGHSREADPEKRLFWKNFVQGDATPLNPVVGVSWEDAQAFCRWLSERDQLTYDLPTEAQWEFACRAGTQTLWSFGNQLSQLESHAMTRQTGVPHPSDIGLKTANPFGLFDMHGNVDEWCLDWHSRDFYSRSPLVEPACLTTPEDPGSGRVSRGGAWNADAWWSRSAIRTYDHPRNPVLPKGFRVIIRGELPQHSVPAPSVPTDSAPKHPDSEALPAEKNDSATP